MKHRNRLFKSEIRNGYQIRYNPLFKKLIISHKNIGAGLAEFLPKQRLLALQYCNNG